MLEIGTSTGYSNFWPALAYGKTGGRIITFEVSKEKARPAWQTFEAAGLDGTVECITGDDREYL